LRERARRVEAALYGVAGAVIAPPTTELPSDATAPYRPFDVIDHFSLPREASSRLDFQPLVMRDDAHQLHPGQYQSLQEWLMRRELRMARWLLSRLDALDSGEMLNTVTASEEGSVQTRRFTVTRDLTDVVFQTGSARQQERKFFRNMARDMARRYFDRMPL